MNKHDAIVVGSGPNGLAAAITLARAGLSVLVLEAKSSIGGGIRSSELTLPGFMHDVCAAVFPLGLISPFFLKTPLHQFGLKWIQPELALAHPLSEGRGIAFPGNGKQMEDKRNSKEWVAHIGHFAKFGATFFEELLMPLRFPRSPLAMARFGLSGVRTARSFAEQFSSEELRALFGGLAGHSFLSFDEPFSAATALALTLAGEIGGWPIAEGGAKSIATAMAAYFESLGGKIQTGIEVRKLSDIPDARFVLLDLSVRQFVRVAQEKLPETYLDRISRYRDGPGVFKVDWALSGPVPWRDRYSGRAGTVHIGGTFEEIADAENEVAAGKIPEKPFVLLSQPSLFDRSRSPRPQQALWGYCHVPTGSTADMTERIEKQIERFAPGFRDCILAKRTTRPSELESYNSNYIGGDISGGAMDWRQIFSRPAHWYKPYRTPIKNIYLCSSSTPPGAGVHGMCGVHAAQLLLRENGIVH